MSVSRIDPRPASSTVPGPRPARSGAPLLLGPLKVGVRPNSPVSYLVPCLGGDPLKFSAAGLPTGLSLDGGRGLVTGRAPSRQGLHRIEIHAENRLGRASTHLDLLVGPDIALLPPMGWNSWNCWGESVSQERVLRAAEGIVRTGLHRYGWSYVNIDDGWQGERDSRNVLQPNKKFPDMRGLSDAIHGMGLKAGIYSTPWVRSFGNQTGGSSGKPRAHIRDEEKGWYVGERTYEQEDAAQWAEWGFDFLKYDWHPVDLASGRRMREALLATGRDFVFNVTNAAYQEDPQKWADISECFFIWRTLQDRDICDTWESVSSIGFRMHAWRPHVRPGHWNDADMLVVGAVGWNDNPVMTRLTPDEQYTHISLWSLLVTPLMLGCDFDQMDDFTLGLLTNEEVLAINQDVLGDMARPIEPSPEEEVWFKRMSDGSHAIGLFNKSDDPVRKVGVRWEDIGLRGPHTVRNLWEREDLGLYSECFAAEVPAHGVCLLRIHPA